MKVLSQYVVSGIGVYLCPFVVQLRLLARTVCLTLLASLAMISTGVAVEEEKSDPTPLNFAEHAKGVFRQHCTGCHNPTKTSGGLDLTSYGNLMQGGSSGDVVEPGSADDSYLFSLIMHDDSPEMPPDTQRIPDADIEIIRKWIDAGAIAKAGGKARKKKRKPSLALASAPDKRPEVVAMPVGIATESSLMTARPPIAASIVSSPWAPLFAIAAANQVVLYHADVAKKERVLGVLPWQTGKPNVLRFSRDGTLLLGGGGRAAALGYVAVWDVASGDKLFEMGDELDEVLAADLSADGQRIATGGPERIVRIYAVGEAGPDEQPDTDQPLYSIRDHTDWVTAIAFSPDGQRLATGDRNGGVIVRDGKTGEQLFRLPSHKGAVTSIAWRRDGKLFASSSESGKINVVNSRDGKVVKPFDAHKDGCRSVCFTRDGQLLSGGRDKKVALWTAQGKSVRKFSGCTDMLTAVSINDETGQVIAGDFSGQLRTWNLKDGKLSGTLPTNP